MSLLTLLIFLIVIGVMFWATRAICAAFSIPAPIVSVVQVILVILAVVWLLQQLGVGGGPILRLN
jgi:hypothetical protein